MDHVVIRIGPYPLANKVILAPMAGVTDLPFRQLCRKLGAGLVVSEMVTSDVRLWNSRKSRNRLDHTGEQEPRSVQIAGADHRYQHGVPGQEGMQQGRRIGPDA